ncbi:RNA-binding protein 5 [Aplysia californica]|uniref:RNA-binding protein 5 n=1 Tax=Aplysia californica TaxID=6500 RepID=A0ABM0JL46_APLCA|nr:RNA-binding protein 5 [Aplysia californica]XP_005096262.1 RNA-binding protein 5 [Aplysia californica]
MDFPNPYQQNSKGFGFGGNFSGNNATGGQEDMTEMERFALQCGRFGPSGFEGRSHDYSEAELLRMKEMRSLGDYMGREPLPPGVEDGAYLARERGRERDRDQRDMRSRDDRDRGRDRDRRRDSDRDRRGGDWSQERERGRHRDRSGNRDRSPMHSGSKDYDGRGPMYESFDDDYGSEEGDRGDRYRGREDFRGDSSRNADDKAGDKWVCNQPSRTIILRGLHVDITEKIIGAELMMLGLPVKDIRLIRRSSGVSRGFAFVEFHNVADAQRWMEHTQGTITLLNQYRAHLAYSVTRTGNRDNSNLQRNDWVCIKCLGHNFKRRDYCYNCNLPRKESEKGKPTDGQEEIGTNPCNTLIFRGLDALTTEEALVTALTQSSPQPLAPIKNVAIIRDDLNTSRGFGFVEFHTVQASTLVLDALNKLSPPLEVDGKQLLINYAKNTFNTTMAYIQQQQQQAQYYDSNYYQGGQYYDAATQQYYDYSQYYAQAGAPVGTTAATTTAAGKGENTTNAAAAVAHAAIQQAQAAKNYQKQIQKKVVGQNETVVVNGVEYPVYPPPDTSQYQYEETSGFYYDPSTQLYYDANSQYYYNSTTGQYMYWDAEKSTYLPAPTGGEDSSGADGSDGAGKKDGKDKKDKEKVKIAKKIAKDMEKWAKSMNAQKEAQKEVMKRPQGPGGSFKLESAAADAGFAMLQKAKEDMTMMPPPPLIGKTDKSSTDASQPGLVASYGGDSDSGDEEDSYAPVDESKLVDWTKLACLLCKRQFQSKEILSKHTQVSQLHKQNLESLSKSRENAGTVKLEYRDRAKERRLKYGAPEPPEPRKRKEAEFEEPAPVAFEAPTKSGISGDNIGNKLLQKMGWSQGQGLGKANQGRTDPIEAQRRNQMAGLGARGANVVADVGDNYRDALKKTMFARYNEVE